MLSLEEYKMEIKDLKELIKSLDQSSIQTFEMEENNLKLKISKEQNSVIMPLQETLAPMTVAQTQVLPIQQAQPQEPQVEVEIEEDDSLIIVQSPMVGVFYASPSPESDVFVQVGSHVKKGQPLCIIEAMKIMNEIEAEIDGEIVEILVGNEDVLEYGQPIMKVRSTS